MLRKIEICIAWLCKIAISLSAIFLMSIFLLICYAVFMRYFYGQPQPWIDEIIGWLLVGSVMFAVPEIQRRGEHIGIDLVLTKASIKNKRLLMLFSTFTVFLCAMIFVREGWVMVKFSHMLNVLSNQVPEVPLFLVQALIPLGFAIMGLVSLMQFILFLIGEKPTDMAETLKEEA